GEIAQDRQQIATVRATIDAACDCQTFDGTSVGKRRADYIRCGKQIVRSAARNAALREECVRTAAYYVKESTCGADPLLNEQPCVRVRSSNGSISCSIKATAKNACRSTASRPAVSCGGQHADWTHCTDAADTN